MANSVSIQVLENGPRNVKVKLTGTIDTSDIATTTLIDPTELINDDGSVNTRLVVDKVTYNIEKGCAVDLLWDAPVDSPIISLVNASDELEFKQYGGLSVPTTLSITSGNINYRTRGWQAGQILSFSIVVEARKCSETVFMDIAAQVNHILTMWDGSLYLPSPTSCFQDVAGTTPCTVDTSVALMLDEMRTLGSELVTNGDFSAGTTGWVTALGATQGASGGVLTVTQGTPAAFGQTGQTITTVVGKTYNFKADVVGGTGVSAYYLNVEGVPQATSGIRSVSTFFVATVTNTHLVFSHMNTNAVGSTIQIDNISVREVTGIHATQATAGFRPVLRGKVKNLLTWSEDFSNAAWNLSATASKTGTNQLNFPAEGDYVYQLCGGASASAVGIYNTGSITMSGSGTITLVIASSIGVYEQAAVVVTLTATPTRYSVTKQFANSGHTNSILLLNRNAGNTATAVTVDEAQLELGTVANPYVSTGATVASSSYGPYWLDFDGVDDRMQLSAVPFQTNDAYFAVAGAQGLSATGGAGILGVSTGTVTGELITIARNVSSAQAYSATGGVTAQTNSGALYPSVPLVSAIKKAGTTQSLLVNGVSIGSASTATQPASAYTVAHIGAYYNLLGFWNGPIYSIALGKGAITDSQLLTIERYVGQQTDVVI